MILVSGATGNVGGELVRALAAAGEPVRALARGGSAKGLPAGVEVATGDLDRPDSLREALSGVDGVFLLSGYQDMEGLAAEIRRAGAQCIVLLSGSSADGGEQSNAISRYMMRSEAAVRESGLDWTFVRPYGFMSNALQWVDQLRAGDAVRAPFADVAVAVIDPFDIAAVAARALLDGGHEGRSHLVSGPESLLPADRVRILGAVLGRALRFEAQPDAEARAEMSAGMPPEYVDAFFRFYVDGTLEESHAQPAVRDITGREPRTFEQWALDHAGAFR